MDGYKQKDNNRCWQGCGETKNLHALLVGMFTIPQKAKYTVTGWPSNFTPRWNESLYLHKKFVHQCS